MMNQNNLADFKTWLMGAQKREPLGSGNPASGRLTSRQIEIPLYMAILGLAALVRLYRLGLAPLSGNEATQALATWQASPPPSGASPALYALNSLVFGLFGVSDGLARLAAALIGIALVGLPFFLRQRLGRSGALGASLVLALSPTAIAASRTINGEIVVALASLGMLVAGDRYLKHGDRRALYGLAGLLALALTGGSSLYNLIVILAGSLGIGLLVEMTSQGDPAATTRQSLTALQSNLLRDWKGAALIAVVGTIGLSTLLLTRPAGLGAVGNLLAHWLDSFRPGVDQTHWLLPFQILFAYELLALLTGLGGLLIASLRNDSFGIFLGYWGLAAVTLTALRPGRSPQEVVLAIVPLACLAGYVFDSLAGMFQRPRPAGPESAFIIGLLVILAFEMLGLADYAVNPHNLQAISVAGRSLMVHRAAIQIILATLLLGITLLLMIGLKGPAVTLRSSTLAGLVGLSLAAWAAGWGAAQVHPGDPHELLSGPRPTSTEVRLMIATLEGLSEQQNGLPYSLPMQVVKADTTVATSGQLDDVIRWNLRDFKNAQFVSTLDPASAPAVVIVPGGDAPALASSYAGQDFAITAAWSPAGATTAESLRWLLYRWTPAEPTPKEAVVIWMKQELSQKEVGQE